MKKNKMNQYEEDKEISCMTQIIDKIYHTFLSET